MAKPELPVVLVVGTGARGGIGRFENLLVAALDEIPTCDVLCIWRRAHPQYLVTDGSNAPSGEAEESHSESGSKETIRFVANVLRLVQRRKPTVVIFTHVNLAQIAVLPPAVGFRGRFIVMAYGTEVWDRLPLVKRTALRRASQVVCISNYTARRVAESAGVAHSRITVRHLALEPSWPQTSVESPRGSRSRSRLRFLTVSRLEAEDRAKGVDAVIRALPLVVEDGLDVEAIIVGAGDDLPYLKALAERSAVGSHVVFMEAVGHKELLSLYSSSDVFVLPSQQEGFGLVFLEAMASGLPVVARRAAGAVDVVIDDVTGVLIDGPDELASALVDLARDPVKRHRLGNAGFERQKSLFSFSQFVKGVREIVEPM